MPGLTLLSAAYVLLASVCLWAECLPFTEAQKHVGEKRCVAGKVWHVKEGNGGVSFLDFCEDYRLCPFTVIIFPHDLKDVGDVRELTGKTIEIRGDIKMYDGRAEIVLRDYKQLGGDAASIPPLPKGFDVEKKGRFSAGKLKYPSNSRRPARKRQAQSIDPMQSESQEQAPE